jgi:precorrin-3B methylase
MYLYVCINVCDPLKDVEVISLELILADLSQIEKRLEKVHMYIYVSVYKGFYTYVFEYTYILLCLSIYMYLYVCINVCDPLRDVEVISLELILADLSQIEKRLEKVYIYVCLSIYVYFYMYV